MLAVLSLACLLSLSHVLAYARIFQSNDDDFSFDSIYDWRTKKEQRNADLEAYLRQVMMLTMANPPRRPGQQHGWPPHQLQSLPLSHQRHQFQQGSSDFAVPPSDSRFFDPPPWAPHLYYSRDEAGPGPRQRDEEWTTEGKREEEPAEETPRPAQPDISTPSAAETVEDETEEVVKTPLLDMESQDNIVLIALIAGSSTAAVGGVALLIYGFFRLQKKAKDAADVEYPAYGVTGPNKEATPTGDRRLAHSAQMYHYQLTKQQIIAMESSSRGERRGSVSEADSEDDENEEGDYTVYECPGLAPTGEMEVKNPLFQDETTPANNDQSKE